MGHKHCIQEPYVCLNKHSGSHESTCYFYTITYIWYICLLQSADLTLGRHVQIINYFLSYQSFCIK